MISCTVEDPDGGGGGGDSSDEVGDYKGTGDGVLSYGSQWWNIPSYVEITKMDVTRIVYDEDESLNTDVILITVTDNGGDWWKVVIEFDKDPDEIVSIKAKTGSGQTGTHTGTPISLPLSNPVDLLSMSNYDNIFATYFFSNVDADNCLVTYLGDESNIKHRALVFYEMTIE